jgi:hypothetical protein
VSGPGRITLGLVSHTNVGKTTLARTLLRRDVGEVRDEAHVTDTSEVHTLIETDTATLRLYDTPGLGDTVRLLRRLRGESNPVGWLLAQVWDRLADRPFWSSQQAVRTARDETDVVLYLVNAAEAPEHAGYLAPELDLLTWVGRPVVMLLNQTGPARPRADLTLEARWREAARPWSIVRDVLPLDAFSRCWVHEGMLFERILPLLPEGQHSSMRQCAKAWSARNLGAFRHATARMAAYLVSTATDSEPLGGSATARLGEPGASLAARRRAVTALRDRLERATAALIGDLIAAQGLAGRPTARLRESLEDFSITDRTWLTPQRGAALGGVASGALGGLAADVLACGLSFGGGVVAGVILGALGGAGLGQGIRLVRGERVPSASWSEPFLRDLCRRTVLRYLAIAHFGRGRGGYEEVELPDAWRVLVDESFAAADAKLAELWQLAARDAEARAESEIRLDRMVGDRTRAVLAASYPEAAHLLHDPR